MVLFFIVQAGLDIAINRLKKLSINVVGLATLPSTNNNNQLYVFIFKFSLSHISTHTHTHTHTFV